MRAAERRTYLRGRHTDRHARVLRSGDLASVSLVLAPLPDEECDGRCQDDEQSDARRTPDCRSRAVRSGRARPASSAVRWRTGRGRSSNSWRTPSSSASCSGVSSSSSSSCSPGQPGARRRHCALPAAAPGARRSRRPAGCTSRGGRVGFQKLGSCGGAVLVDESTKQIVALDRRGTWWAGSGDRFGRYERERPVRAGICRLLGRHSRRVTRERCLCRCAGVRRHPCRGRGGVDSPSDAVANWRSRGHGRWFIWSANLKEWCQPYCVAPASTHCL